MAEFAEELKETDKIKQALHIPLLKYSRPSGVTEGTLGYNAPATKIPSTSARSLIKIAPKQELLHPGSFQNSPWNCCSTAPVTLDPSLHWPRTGNPADPSKSTPRSWDCCVC